MRLHEKLSRLATDVERISLGQGPTAEELASAPLLLNWHFVKVPETILGGYVFDHPKLGAGQITTSLLYTVSPDLTWARTLSRYYRLGLPKEQ